jgi:LacI family transcriptional regulator
MQKLLSIDPDITAVFASSDVQALGAWKALREIGRRVPEEAAIVGFDDIKISRYIGLTSVDQDMQSVGYETVELLLKRSRGESVETVSKLVTPRLNVRATSDYLRSN